MNNAKSQKANPKFRQFLNSIDPFRWLQGSLILYTLLIFLIFRNRDLMSSGDDLNGLNPHQIFHFFAQISEYYQNSNGRLGELISLVTWKRFNQILSVQIFNYPWWLLKCLCYLGVALSGVILSQTLLDVLKQKNRTFRLIAGGFVVVFFSLGTLVTVSTPEVVVMLINYSIPMLVGTLLFRMSVQAQTRQNRALLFVYFYCCISHEQFLMAGMVTSFFLLFYNYSTGKIKRPDLPKLATAWGLLHSLAFCIFIFSPGQATRNISSGSLGSPSIGLVKHFGVAALRWFQQSSRTFKLLIDLGDSPSLLFFWLFFIFILGLGFKVLHVLIKSGFKLKNESDKSLFWTFAFVLAGFSSGSTLLISPYFPDRARLYPMLCFQIALVCLMNSIWIKLSDRFNEKWIQNRAPFAVATLIVFGVSHLNRSLLDWSILSARDITRGRTYATLAKKAQSGIHTNFHIHDCPVLLDAPWGIRGFLSWADIPSSTQVILDGTNSDEANLKQLRSDSAEPLTEIQCQLEYPKFSAPPTLGAPIPPLYTLIRVSSAVSSPPGEIALLFPIYREFSHCQGYLSYNPNVSGSTLYSELKSFIIGFRRTWGTGEVVVVGEGHPFLETTGGANQHLAVQWLNSSDATAGFPYNSLASVQDNSLMGHPRKAGHLKVSLNHLSPNYLGFSIQSQLKCE